MNSPNACPLASARPPRGREHPVIACAVEDQPVDITRWNPARVVGRYPRALTERSGAEGPAVAVKTPVAPYSALARTDWTSDPTDHTHNDPPGTSAMPAR